MHIIPKPWGGRNAWENIKTNVQAPEDFQLKNQKEIG